MMSVNHRGSPPTPRAAWRWVGLIVVGAAMMALSALSPDGRAQETGRAALVIDVDGAIGPAVARHIHIGFEQAVAERASVVVLRMDTPGGLDTSMREIIQEMLSVSVPVAVFVGPAGARAASAGTYILYASHVAAMAPGTNLGAATPVAIGGGKPSPLPKWPDGKPDKKPEKDPFEAEPEAADDTEPAPAISGNAMATKAVNDAAAYIRSLAEMRGRNVEWAERAVRAAESLTAQQALDQNVIDIMAHDVADLLTKIDGREVMMADTPVRLETANLRIVEVEPDWQTEFLGVLTNPNVAFMLLMLGVYGLIFEFYHPGTVGPGVIGAISLLLGLYALNLLPLDYTGLGLLLVGIACMVAEAFVPSFGILGIGGLASFILGAILLFDSDVPAFRLSWWVIAGTGITSGLLFSLLLGYVWRAHRRPVTTGNTQLTASEARVIDWAGESGHVQVHGERWRAAGTGGLSPGDVVSVREVQGLTVIVDKPGGAKEAET